jgi:tetratricopeptide (TPR) repeat protein
MKTFRRVLDRAPRHTLARYNLALALQRADRLPEAIAELDRAIGIEPRPEATRSG